MSLCTRCRRNLIEPRNRYEWLISRGWSQKDAAAEALQNPSTITPVRTCCINELHTNVDVEKDMLERLDIQNRAKAKKIAQERLEGIPEPRRETVEIYCKDVTGQLGGYFILVDADFDDPKILAKPFQEVGKGYEITNIALLPKEIADREPFKWSETERPLCLWSGNIKIVPVIKIDDKLSPAVMYQSVQRQVVQPSLIMGQPPQVVTIRDETTLSERIDRTLLGADIKYFNIGVRDNQIPGGTIRMPFHIISVLKQLSKKE